MACGASFVEMTSRIENQFSVLGCQFSVRTQALRTRKIQSITTILSILRRTGNLPLDFLQPLHFVYAGNFAQPDDDLNGGGGRRAYGRVRDKGCSCGR